MPIGVVKLQWAKEPPKEIVASLNQELKVDCLAQGEPKPLMRWEKLDSLQSLTATNKQQRQVNNLISADLPPTSSARNQLASSKCRVVSCSAELLARVKARVWLPPISRLGRVLI